MEAVVFLPQRSDDRPARSGDGMASADAAALAR